MFLPYADFFVIIRNIIRVSKGLDGDYGRHFVLKEYSNEISPILDILALIFSSGVMYHLDDWRHANVSWGLFKRDETYAAANYRPVRCKTIEYILVSIINKHIAVDSRLADYQHGFLSWGLAKPSWSSLCTYIINNHGGYVSWAQTDTLIL